MAVRRYRPINYPQTGGGSTAWGDITGTLSAQTDLQAALDAKAASTNVANWDTAFGWGDHSGLYEPIDATIVRDGDSPSFATVSGTHVIGGTSGISSEQYRLYDSKGGSNEDNWLLENASGTFQLSTSTDASPNTVATTVISCTRVGTTPGTLTFNATASFTGAVSATGAVTGSNLNVSNWDTAFGWGDHSGLYSLAAHNHSGVYEPVDADIARTDTNDVITAEWSVPSVPRNKTSSYTMVLGDAGQVVRFTGATASKVCTIPANASVAFPIGTMIGITNDGSVTMTLAITTDTMTWGKDNTTGTRTLAAGADCVILKTTATTWKVNGSALVT